MVIRRQWKTQVGFIVDHKHGELPRDKVCA